MPLYEYQCTGCSERVEVIQKMSDPPYTVCPKCGGAMKKLFSSPAIQFKGSGFYKTDYGSGSSGAGRAETKSGGKSDAGSDSKGESKGESRGDSKGDSKGEVKSESKGESKGESKSDSRADSQSASKRDSKERKSE